MPQLIIDLAVMLLTAGIVAIVFKKIKQPVVLGYILAGFLVGPYMPYFFTVADEESIHIWSEIGIIILMFALGLEFNLHKLISVGKTAIITAITQVLGLMVIGYFTGLALGWSTMDALFLGGMLSMSSTTIIIKAFDELGVMKEKYAQLVFGILVIEDIAGIFMMIILSTVSVQSSVSGTALVIQLSILLLYLVMWLLLGIFILPTLLKKASGFLNDETLLLLSLGLCFGMVLLANRLGFSSALGAFLSGSLIAGTVHAERVEHLTSGIKDLFGAVFFLSVGMLIEPAMVVRYVGPILIITFVTIFIKIIVSVIGVLLSGETLRKSIRCGCALGQIGEFAFIIASLGMSLGVLDSFVYPIIVSVSVITTLTTPAFIKAADKIYGFCEKRLPEKWKKRLSDYTEDDNTEKEQQIGWGVYLKQFIRRTAIYGVVMIGIALITVLAVYPALSSTGMSLWVARLLSVLILLAGIAIFIRPMIGVRSSEFTALWVADMHYHLPLITLNTLRFIIIVMIVFIPVRMILEIHSVLLLPLIALTIILFARSGWLASTYINVEARFLANLNERKLDSNSEEVLESMRKDFLVWRIECDESFEGKTLQELDWGRRFRLNIIRIGRGNKTINMPSAGRHLHAGDRILVLGKHEDLHTLSVDLGIPLDEPLMTLDERIENQKDPEDDFKALYTHLLPVRNHPEFAGKSIRQSKVRDKYDCMILGVSREKLPILQPDINMILQPNDEIWLLGSNHMVEQLLAEGEFDPA